MEGTSTEATIRARQHSHGDRALVDGVLAGEISSYGPRKWQTELPVGTVSLKIIDLGPRPGPVLDETISVKRQDIVFVQFRGPYRRRLFGPRIPTECWISGSRPPPSWFAPTRK